MFLNLKKLAILSISLSLPLSALAKPVDFPPKNNQNQTLSYFFIQTAAQAILKPGQLTLKKVNPKNIWFADAPSQLSGFTNMNTYMQQLWGNANSAYNVTAPNASLAGYVANPHTHKHERVNMILTLKKASYQPTSQTLTYKVNKLLFAHSFQQLSSTLTVEQPTLFIDTYDPMGGSILIP
jgi:hypothetical protein